MSDLNPVDTRVVEQPYPAVKTKLATLTEANRNGPDICALYSHAIAAADSNINWYRTRKRPKQQLSHFLRCTALALVIIGGLCPLLPNDGKLDVGRYGYILLAAGGGLLLFDKFFGLSSSWMRFMTAAEEIEALLDVFKVDWASESSKIRSREATSEIDPRFQLIKDFLFNMHAVIERETNEWKAEFQKGIVHFETLLRQHSETAGQKNRR